MNALKARFKTMPPLDRGGQARPGDDATDRRRAELTELLLVAALLLAAPVLILLGRLTQAPVWLLAGVSGGPGAYYAWRTWQIRKRLKRHLTGRENERFVGEVLMELRGQGYKTLHAIPFPGGDIDHVVIGTRGVFSIETKIRQRHNGERSQVDYDGERVLVNGVPPERDPVQQARRQAGWLEGFAKETAGGNYHVRPVVWYVNSDIDHENGAAVWVVNERLFPLFLKDQPECLTPKEVGKLYEAFSRVARSVS